MDITRKYQSDFGKWYVQVPVNGQNTEFAFDHDPEPIEIAVAIARYEQSVKPTEATVELEAEMAKSRKSAKFTPLPKFQIT